VEETTNTNTGVFASLPLISKLPSKKMKKAQTLLEELDALEMQIDTAAERKEEIQMELETIQTDAEMDGLRFGGLCFRASTVAGRKTLDKTRLVENGCTLEIIEASYKTGKDYTKREFKRIEL